MDGKQPDSSILVSGLCLIPGTSARQLPRAVGSEIQEEPLGLGTLVESWYDKCHAAPRILRDYR